LKVLVFGAGGQLGSELERFCRLAGDELDAWPHARLDLTDLPTARNVVITSRPDVVFNAAAYTKVDRAEEERATAVAVNGEAPATIAEACRDIGAGIVHFSTDYVFDGAGNEPIPEDAPPRPLNAYGESKLLGEQRVIASGARAFVVRSSWLYSLHGSSFVQTVLRTGREKGEMRVVNDQRGSPTWARDLAVASRRLVDVGQPGVYHLTNAGDCSWYELASAIVDLAGIEARIDPIRTAEYPTPARRPAYSVLANASWRALGEPPLRPWREALSECLSEMTA
jgi:dTDP-4-dehydrorhamnose reductase